MDQMTADNDSELSVLTVTFCFLVINRLKKSIIILLTITFNRYSLTKALKIWSGFIFHPVFHAKNNISSAFADRKHNKFTILFITWTKSSSTQVAVSQYVSA